MEEKRFDHVLDLKELTCPRTLLKLKEVLHGLQRGQVLKVIATDKTTMATFPPYLRRSGDSLLLVEEVGREVHHFIEKS